MTIKVTYNVTDVYMTQSVSPVYINVSYSGSGTLGGGVWGTITGTLSNQTDLQNALNAKVPYSGATGDVNLGEYELKAGQLTLDVSPTGTAAVGTTRWNDTTGVSETTLKGGNVLLRNGVDLVARVVNKVTPNTTLTKAAYQAVRVSGAQGQRLAVAFAQANNDANSADTIGLVIETIPTNQEGFIMAVGQLENINTTGSLQGETWADGDVLYLSPTIAGAITKVKPTGNGHIVVIGYVEYAHANNGKIYVKVMNGWELDELHDVSIVSVANNEALIYESSSALWKNKSIATALGYTPANAATTLTINGVTYDLSTSRTWTIAAGIGGTIATGQVAYATAANTLGGSNNLFWDNANGRLGIGTNAPAATLHSNGSVHILGTDASNTLTIRPNALVSSTFNTFEVQTTAGAIQFAINRNGPVVSAGQITIAGQNIYRAGDILFRTSAPVDNGIIGQTTQETGSTTLGFTSSLSRKFTFSHGIYSLGNAIIGSAASDFGTRLQVYGDTLLRGSGATSATTALTVQDSGGTAMLTLRNDGVLRLQKSYLNLSTDLNVGFGASNDGSSFNSSGLGISFAIANRTSAGVNIGFYGGNITNTSGAFYHIRTTGVPNFAPTSGTGTYHILSLESTINQTGGANGITRGLYVNPTLTAAADFRAIETARGNIVFANLPTSSAGLPSGALWNNGGVINIV